MVCSHHHKDAQRNLKHEEGSLSHENTGKNESPNRTKSPKSNDRELERISCIQYNKPANPIIAKKKILSNQPEKQPTKSQESAKLSQ